MKRILDLVIVLNLALTLLLPLIIISILVKFSSRGPILYWSKRVGKDNSIFLMPKFRTMIISTPELATHLLKNPEAKITYIGKFLRTYSVDELPQIWSVFKGDMSFVGPRPALYNQFDLINLRHKKGISTLKPGLTGWAQINGRDNLSIPQKVSFDEYYLKNKTLYLDIKILWITLFSVISRENVTH